MQEKMPQTAAPRHQNRSGCCCCTCKHSNMAALRGLSLKMVNEIKMKLDPFHPNAVTLRYDICLYFLVRHYKQILSSLFLLLFLSGLNLKKCSFSLFLSRTYFDYFAGSL